MGFQDLTGQRFGRLTAVRRTENIKKATRWLCQCDCGVQKTFQAGNLKSGATTSCGCLAVELTITRSTRHGKACKGKVSPEYYCWKSIHKRTSNPKFIGYKDYGGRGITMCERWKSFENFIEDMGDRPSPEHSIDRIDNDKGYFPDNCRWTTRVEQSNNKRSNRLFTYKGETRTIAEWSKIRNIRYITLHSRLIRLKMTTEDALERPVVRRVI